MPPVQAIETRYAGCRFRSRLEARWAVFFDALNIEWQYEPQGYLVTSSFDQEQTRPYLPDFWLPATQTWAEVKGHDAAVDWNFLAAACDWHSALPGLRESGGTTRGLLLLGPVPRPHPGCRWLHPGVQQHKGVTAEFFIFHGCCGLVRPPVLTEAGIGEGHWGWHWNNCGDPKCTPETCTGSPPSAGGVAVHGFEADERVAAAYTAARSARFEHGQSGGLS